MLAIPPGETIKEMLEDRHMIQRELAFKTGLSESYISRLIKGKTTLFPEIAKVLSNVLGPSPTFWLNLEAGYRRDLELEKEEKKNDE